MDEEIGTFCAFTSATPQQAQQFLALTDGNVEQAVELFFNNPDLGASATATARTQQPRPAADPNEPIEIDDDEDLDDDVQMIGSRRAGATGGASVEDDEAMARRLQEEMYGGGGRRGDGGGGGMGGDLDEGGIRAPMARTTETLVGPGSASDWLHDPDAMQSAVFQQMQARQRNRGAAPGIFNQREAASIWAEGHRNDPETHRQLLAQSTGGASEQTSKSNHLAELFRPPWDLISKLDWSDARDEGKEAEKWILVNVQDPSIFDCQVLNRDIWKNEEIRDTVKEHFIFLQYNKDDPRGQEYIQYYFANMRDSEDAYPHIAVVDPRTGEQVKTWSGSPGPKVSDFMMDLHEFLDRYSLKMEKKNPVQAMRKEHKKDVAQMSEEEMLEMALANSLANGTGPREEDPDSLTRPPDVDGGKGKGRAVDADAVHPADGSPEPTSANGAGPPVAPAAAAVAAPDDTPFSRISADHPHEEPASTGPDTTRIQFRHSGGRVVRRFLLADPVRRIYEWLKAAPLEGKAGASFEIIALGRNLVDVLDTSIGEAGLKNASVMVEFVDGDE